MRGRKPNPTFLRVLRNNPGKRKVNRDEPIGGAMTDACPEEITEPDAKKEWNRVIAPAIRSGQITASDRVLAIAHCELWATWRSQLADAAKHAHVVAVGAHKYPTQNPARVMSNKTLMLLAKVDAELGFSPTSRTRVQVRPGTGRSSTSEFRRAKSSA